jgi:hypothetical protein
MSRAATWRLATLCLVGGLALRALWLAWQYYFAGGPRYRVESAMIALVVVGVIVVALRRANTVGPVLSDRPPSAPRWWLAVFLVAAPTLYYGAIDLGFLSDDYTLRTMARSDSLGAGTGWFFRPLPLLLWRGLLAITDSAVTLHLLNVLLHGLNAYLVSVLGRALGMRREAAFAAALLLLTFPALAEAVVWAAGVQDVLMTTMALSAVALCAREAPGVGRMAAVCGVLILGLGSKETAVCIPVLVALCWATRERVRRDRAMYAAMAAVTVLYLAIRLPMGIAGDYLGEPTRYFFKQMIVVAFGTLSTPWRAPASFYEHWRAFAAAGVIVLLLVHAYSTWRRSEERFQRQLRLASWVLASIAPVFTLFFVGPTLEGSRYLYLGSCAWSLLVADLLASASGRLSARPHVFRASVAVIVVVFAISVQREVGVWREAADVRDRVLAEARTTLNRSGCATAAFASVPDSVNGAYVFRNGFPEAIGIPVADPNAASPECTFIWMAGRFARSR